MRKTPWDGLPLLKAEMEALEELLRKEFRGGGFIQAEAGRLVLGGGKRLRPALVIASAHVGSYDRQATLPVAAAMEVLHAATLIHDDVIDGADTRRGMATVHSGYGNHVAIYAGDFLLAKAVMLLSQGRLPQEELRRIASAMEAMCVGEVSQYLGKDRVPGYREYLKRIMGKTGILFASACTAGGHSAGLSQGDTWKLWRFGMRLGAAFQIRDDLLDIEGEGAGKPTERDLAEGVVTLPILLAAANAGYRAMLTRFFTRERTADAVRDLLETARRMGVVESTREVLREEVNRSIALLETLPESPGRDMLGELAGMLI
jgi:heptaprenyl diphosphate synthase